MDPKGRSVGAFDNQNQADYDMSDNEDCEIRWRIIGLMVVKFLTTFRALVLNCQIAVKNGT